MSSQVIDTKVVELRFDNSNFESKIQASLAALKNFTKSVDDSSKNTKAFDGLAASCDDVGLALENVNMKSKISVSAFSLLQTAGVKAFNSISESIASFGMRMADQLSGMKAMRDGFAEYELKMGSVQTILNGAKIIDPETDKDIKDTSERLEIVNQKLEDLNRYSDKTIYSFKDMTSNIGKFTNAGVNLDDSVQAIQGVANVAAVSGANAEEASRAMYNFSQALSSGAVKLVDWKSIENANMATVEFKQQLLDTAVALGTVVKEGDMYKTTTTDAQGKVSEAFNATMKFNDALSNQWMTTEVLTQTLKNYSTDVNDFTDNQIASYKKQLEEAGYAEDQIAAIAKEGNVALYKESLKLQGYTDEQIDGIIELSKKAFDAATEVKTFSQMIDTLGESIGSQWAQTWELVIGDFNEAKELWTGVNNVLDKLLTTGGKIRNMVLTGWKDDGGRTALLNSFKNLYQAVVNLLKPFKELINAIFPSTEEEIKGVGKGLADATRKFEKFTGFVAKVADVIGNVIGKILKPVAAVIGFIIQKIGQAIGWFKSAFGTIKDFLKPAVDAFNQFVASVKEAFSSKVASKMTGFGKSFAKTFNDIRQKIEDSAALQKLVEAFSKLRDILQDLFGRAMISASSVANRFVNMISRIWAALKPILTSIGTSAIGKLSDFILPKLAKAAEFVTEKLEKLTSKFEGLSFDKTGIWKTLNELPKKLTGLSKTTNMSGVTKGSSAAAKEVKTFGEALTFLKERIQDVKPKTFEFGDTLIDKVKKWAKFITGENGFFAELKKAFEDIKEVFEGLGKSEAFTKIMDLLIKGLDRLQQTADKTREILEKLFDTVRKVTPKLFKSLFNYFAGPDGILTLSDITIAFENISAALSGLMTSMGVLGISKAAGDFTSGIKGIADALKIFAAGANEVGKAVANRLKWESVKDFAIAIGILAGAVFLLAQINDYKKLAAAAAAIISVAGAFTYFFTKLGTSKWDKGALYTTVGLSALFLALAANLIAVSIAVGVLVGALALLPTIVEKYNDLGDKFATGMQRVREVLTEISNTLATFAFQRGGFGVAAELIAVVLMLNGLRKTIEQYASAELAAAMETGFGNIKKVLNMMAAFFATIRDTTFGINIGNLNTLGMAAVILAITNMLKNLAGPLQTLAYMNADGRFDKGFDAVKQIIDKLAGFLTEMVLLTTGSGIFGAFARAKGGGKGAATGFGDWLGLSLTIASIANAISTIVGSLDTIVGLVKSDANAYKTAFRSLEVIFIELAAVMYIMGKFNPKGAASLLVLGITIGLLTACMIALTPLAKTDFPALIGAAGALGVLMLTLGAVMYLIGQAAGKTSLTDILLLIGMVAAMTMLANGLRRLAQIGDPGSITTAALAISVAAIAVAGAMALIGEACSNPIALAGMALLTLAIWGIVAAIYLLTKSSNEGASAIGDMADTASEAGYEIKDGLTTPLKEVPGELNGLANDAVSGIDVTGSASEVGKAGKESMLNSFTSGGLIVPGLASFFNIDELLNSASKGGSDAKTAMAQGFMSKDVSGLIGDDTINGLVGSLISGDNLSELYDAGALLGDTVDEGTKGSLEINSPSRVMFQNGIYVIEGLLQGLMTYPEKLAGWAEGLKNTIVSAAKDAISAYSSKLGAGAKEAKAAAGRLVSGVSSKVSSVKKDISTAASTAAKEFGAKLSAGAATAKTAAESMVSGAKKAFANIRASFMTFGRNAAEGFKAGINNMIASVAQKAAEMVKRAKEAAKAAQNSHSPSKDFMEFGNWAAQGYAIGLVNKDSERLIAANAAKMVTTAKNAIAPLGFGSLSMNSDPAVQSLAMAMTQINDTLSSGLETSPRIRPVIDMSNVNRNASAISGLFGTKGISANLEAAMSIKDNFESRQNHDAQMVSEMHKLSKEISSMTTAMNSRTLNVYNSIEGSSDPTAFANDLVAAFRLNARTV